MANRSSECSSEFVVGEEYRGTCVHWVDQGRGYGFVHVAGMSCDVFVSARALLEAAALERGDWVAFEARMDDHGRIFGDQVRFADV